MDLSSDARRCRDVTEQSVCNEAGMKWSSARKSVVWHNLDNVRSIPSLY